jgi:LysR family transcriptional regulator, regulator for bpeEF and oprC
MDRFEAMRMFVRVVEASSFTKASETLDLSPAKISKAVQALEERIGVRLLNRSTRRLTITDDGAAYYDRCLRILAEVEDAEASLSNRRRAPSGTVRVDMSSMLAHALLIPALGEFHQRYPEIAVRLGLADRTSDLFEGGVDCLFRMGEIEEASLVVRRIGDARIVTCAAPAYLNRHGEPALLDELGAHKAVNHVSPLTRKTFPFEFETKNGVVRIQMDSALAVNDGSVYVDAGVAGHGIIQPPRFMVRDLIAHGALREILTSYRCPSIPLSVVYPHRRNQSARLRVFVDWVGDIVQRHADLTPLAAPRAPVVARAEAASPR